MKSSLPALALLSTLLIGGGPLAGDPDPLLQIETGVELTWSTTSGHLYALQSAVEVGGPWSSLTEATPGDGQAQSFYHRSAGGALHYRILETIPATDPAPQNPVNGGFETGTGTAAEGWSTGASQPPRREATTAHGGDYAMRSVLANVGSSPAEGLLTQRVVEAGGTVVPGQSYDFSFRARQVSVGPSYIQQYQVQWLNAANAVVGGSGLKNFDGVIGSWIEIALPGQIAPATAVEAQITFRFVTGAVADGHGEVLLDDVVLDDGSAAGPGTPEVINPVPLEGVPVAHFSWTSEAGRTYQPTSSPDFEAWSPLSALIEGDGGIQAVRVALTRDREFFRLEMPAIVVLPPQNLQATGAGGVDAIGLAWTASPSEGVIGYRILYGTSSAQLDQSIELGDVRSTTIPGLTPGETYYLAVVALTADGQSLPGDATLIAMPNTAGAGLIALFDASTPLEAPTRFETADALVTHIADRVRDRHAREAQFQAYDHYLSWYWEQRIASVEIIDRVAKGGTDITFNYSTLARLNPAEFRTFFGGVTTVAQYNNNQIATFLGTSPSAIPGETDYHYTATIHQNANEGNRPLQLGDRVEIEISQFLAAPRHGRSNYYGNTMLYVVGQGIVPWAQGNDLGLPGGVVGNVNRTLDSHPLPEAAWLGGETTQPYQYSNEPEERFKQMAGNLSPTNGIPFMLGRRLHHTDFGDGSHSEAGNPVFTAHVGQLGPAFIARSCVECHVNNGRALPPPIDAAMFQSVVKVGSDASGTPHPILGSVLQTQATSGTPEGSATISGYTTIAGTYGDGNPYSLRRPLYTFSGPVPEYFSVRLAPPLVGMGLLEAVGEEAIAALADPDDLDGDGISGRMRTALDVETGDPRLGRFTYKGDRARVSHQIAAALNADMGVTTSLFPRLEGDSGPIGEPELSDADLDLMTRYVALLGVAAQRNLRDADVLQGEALFTSANCVACHTPTLTTSPFHPYAELRSQTIHPFTDLLLHDMGPGLADNLGEGDASGAEWRTPPLWNIGLTAGVSGGEAYLHDGRARTLEEAILWHGGEAEASKEAFRTLSAEDRAALIQYLKSL